MYDLLPGQYESRTGDLTESVRDAPRPAPRPPFLKDDILLLFFILIILVLYQHHQPRACHPSGWVW